MWKVCATRSPRFLFSLRKTIFHTFHFRFSIFRIKKLTYLLAVQVSQLGEEWCFAQGKPSAGGGKLALKCSLLHFVCTSNTIRYMYFVLASIRTNCDSLLRTGKLWNSCEAYRSTSSTKVCNSARKTTDQRSGKKVRAQDMSKKKPVKDSREKRTSSASIAQRVPGFQTTRASLPNRAHSIHRQVLRHVSRRKLRLHHHGRLQSCRCLYFCPCSNKKFAFNPPPTLCLLLC